MNRWTRRLHRWGAVLAAVPLLLVVVTGLLLQVKKQVPWVQPPTLRGSVQHPATGFDAILDAARSVPEASVRDWADINRLDVQPGRGIVKVLCRNRWELQLDLADGRVLSSNYRRSDLIESLHDGSFFSDGAKLWVFLPNGLILLGLWVTGAWLWWLPWRTRLRKRSRETAGQTAS